MKDRPDEPKEHAIVSRHRRLVGRTVLVSALTLLSRVLGFVREMVSAAIFGDGSAVWDAFLTAWRVPNLFRRLFGEGALSTSLQTAITEADGDGGNEAGRRLFLRTIATTSWILLALTILVSLAVAVLPDLMPLTGWRWLGADPEPVRDLTLRLLPFVLLICITALCGGALHVRGHFAVPNLAPALMNLTWIAALVWIGLSFGWGQSGAEPAEAFQEQWKMARWLAWAVLLGGLVQLLIHLPPLMRHGLVRPAQEAAGRLRGGSGQAWAVLRAAAPLAVGAAVYQINVMIDGLMAESLLADGGPTALYYANRIQQFPLALIAIAATNAVFPAMKALGHVGRRRELRELHDRSQMSVLFLALPAAVGLAVLAEPIAAVLFQRGNYGAEGVARMAATLRMLAAALLPAGAVALAGRTYFAMGDFRTPVRVSIAMLTLNVLLNTLFVAGMGMDADGLALATAVTSWGNLLCLLPGLSRRLALPAATLSPTRVVKVLVASASSGAAALAGHWGAVRALGLDTEVASRSIVSLAVGIACGLAVFLLSSTLLGSDEMAELRRRLGGRSQT